MAAPSLSLLASQPPGFFVELPYTLPQDFTLFVILKQKNIEIWKKKLDWVAEKGGMVLLNTHSDYMNFNGGQCKAEEYPAAYYIDFLTYIKTSYKDQYWPALPRDLAMFWQSQMLEGQEAIKLEGQNSRTQERRQTLGSTSRKP